MKARQPQQSSAKIMASVESSAKKKKKKNKEKKQKGRRRSSLSELKTLGNQLLTSRAHVNNLTVLLGYVSSETSPPQHALESLLSLQAFFTPLLPELPSSSAASANAKFDDPEFVYRTWLRSKFDDFLQSLINIAISSHSDGALRVIIHSIFKFLVIFFFKNIVCCAVLCCSSLITT